MPKRLDKIRLNTTCFSEHARCKVSCSNKDCRLWIENEQNHPKVGEVIKTSMSLLGANVPNRM